MSNMHQGERGAIGQPRYEELLYTLPSSRDGEAAATIIRAHGGSEEQITRAREDAMTTYYYHAKEAARNAASVRALGGTEAAAIQAAEAERAAWYADPPAGNFLPGRDPESPGGAVRRSVERTRRKDALRAGFLTPAPCPVPTPDEPILRFISIPPEHMDRAREDATIRAQAYRADAWAPYPSAAWDDYLALEARGALRLLVQAHRVSPDAVAETAATVRRHYLALVESIIAEADGFARRIAGRQPRHEGRAVPVPDEYE